MLFNRKKENSPIHVMINKGYLNQLNALSFMWYALTVELPCFVGLLNFFSTNASLGC